MNIKHTGNHWVKDGHFVPKPIRIGSNRKTMGNVMDTIKGCTGKCFWCYAWKRMRQYGISWEGWNTPTPMLHDPEVLYEDALRCPGRYVRDGVFGDPSYSFDHAINVYKNINRTNKYVIMMTSMHRTPSRRQMDDLADLDTYIQCSTSAFDLIQPGSQAKVKRQTNTFNRYRGKWTWRILTFDFKPDISGFFRGTLTDTNDLIEAQDKLLDLPEVMETPAKIQRTRDRKTSELWALMEQGNYIAYHKSNRMTAGRMDTNVIACHTKYCAMCPHDCGTSNTLQTQLGEYHS